MVDPSKCSQFRALLSGVIELKPAKIIYLACNPATQARDIRPLLDRGFTLKSLNPYDMFPQTAHIEVVALLES